MKNIEFVNQAQTAFISAGTDRGCLPSVVGVDGKQCDFPDRVGFLRRSLCIRSESFLRVSAGNGEGHFDKSGKRKNGIFPLIMAYFQTGNERLPEWRNGRRIGLKIRWRVTPPCGFDSHLGHQ